MRLTIVNSTAPGRADLLAPFFNAIADRPGFELTVLEQVPARRFASRLPSSGGDRRYHLVPAPTLWYRRRHACAQVLAPGFGRLLAESRPDVIYLLGECGYLSTFQVVRFARAHLPQAKLCLFAAQNVYQRFPPPFPSLERWVLARIDHAFPLGDDHEQVMRRKGYRGPATHLPLGVDTTVFRPAPLPARRGNTAPPRPVIGYVGDFLPARNLPLLLRAVAAMRAPAGLLLVGEGPGRQELEALCRAYGLADRVWFAGRVPHAQVPAYLHSMDLVVLPSKAVRNRCFGVFRIANAEQFGRALVEAMACGKPVIGSTCGEIPTVIGDAGCLFPEGDLSALTAALDHLCANPALRAQLGQAGLERALAYYDWRVIAHRFTTELEQLAGATSPTPIPHKSDTRREALREF